MRTFLLWYSICFVAAVVTTASTNMESSEGQLSTTHSTTETQDPKQASILSSASTMAQERKQTSDLTSEATESTTNPTTVAQEGKQTSDLTSEAAESTTNPTTVAHEGKQTSDLTSEGTESTANPTTEAPQRKQTSDLTSQATESTTNPTTETQEGKQTSDLTSQETESTTNPTTETQERKQTSDLTSQATESTTNPTTETQEPKQISDLTSEATVSTTDPTIETQEPEQTSDPSSEATVSTTDPAIVTRETKQTSDPSSESSVSTTDPTIETQEPKETSDPSSQATESTKDPTIETQEPKETSGPPSETTGNCDSSESKECGGELCRKNSDGSFECECKNRDMIFRKNDKKCHIRAEKEEECRKKEAQAVIDKSGTVEKVTCKCKEGQILLGEKCQTPCDYASDEVCGDAVCRNGKDGAISCECRGTDEYFNKAQKTCLNVKSCGANPKTCALGEPYDERGTTECRCECSPQDCQENLCKDSGHKCEDICKFKLLEIAKYHGCCQNYNSSDCDDSKNHDFCSPGTVSEGGKCVDKSVCSSVQQEECENEGKPKCTVVENRKECGCPAGQFFDVTKQNCTDTCSSDACNGDKFAVCKILNNQPTCSCKFSMSWDKDQRKCKLPKTVIKLKFKYVKPGATTYTTEDPCPTEEEVKAMVKDQYGNDATVLNFSCKDGNIELDVAATDPKDGISAASSTQCADIGQKDTCLLGNGFLIEKQGLEVKLIPDLCETKLKTLAVELGGLVCKKSDNGKYSMACNKETSVEVLAVPWDDINIGICKEKPCKETCIGENKRCVGEECVCKEGFKLAGDKCISYCDGNPCRNGGTCEQSNSGDGFPFSCKCPSKFKGALCETENQEMRSAKLNIVIVGVVLASLLLVCFVVSASIISRMKKKNELLASYNTKDVERRPQRELRGYDGPYSNSRGNSGNHDHTSL